jgi:hypothetical protein
MTIELGRVTTVELLNNRVYVNAKTSPSFEHRQIEFTTPAVGMWSVPREGDIVEVYPLTTEVYAARFPHTTTSATMPDLSQGDFCFSLNEGTKLWFAQQDDGTVDVRLDADGDVTVNGSSIILGSEGGAQSLAVQSHTHDVDYSWGDSAGSGSATTGTPNEAGTTKTSAE